MNRRMLLAALPLLTVLSALPFLARSGGAAPRPAAVGGSVLVELFTSQGCSSCPPADRLLTRLAADPALAGRVIPLSFHVDYWDSIGWRDPFDAPAWSERQRAYAQAFRSNRIYTPQVVVNGTAECVGSQEREVRRLITEALAVAPKGKVTLEATMAEDRLQVKAGASVAAATGGDLDLWVVVWETGLETQVGAGENASRTLRNDHVVRRLEKALTLAGTPGTRRSADLVLGLDKRWKRSNLGVAAFLQDPATRAVHGAAARALGPAA